jgi:hypothetical protein
MASWADRQVKPLVDGFSTKKSVSTRGFVCLSTRRASRVQLCPALKLRRHRRELGTRRRRLSPGRQALLTRFRDGWPAGAGGQRVTATGR